MPPNEENNSYSKEEIIKIVDGRLGDRWGKFVENLIGGNLITKLNEHNIKVTTNYKNEKGFYTQEGIKRRYEFDIVAKNGNEVVIVEVKTKLTLSDIERFVAKLRQVVKYIDSYKDKKVYGGVAYLYCETDCEVEASRKGLFVIEATGNSSTILNVEEFKPVNFTS